MLFRWVMPFLSLATNPKPEVSLELRHAVLNVRAPGYGLAPFADPLRGDIY